MADISQEIGAFRNAKKGRDVRGSMISLAEKVNTDGEDALSEVAAQVIRIDGIANQATQALTNANAAINTANEAIERADNVLEEGENQVAQAANSATLSKNYSLDSKADADRAQNQADRAEMYSGFVAPQFWINFTSGNVEHTDTDDMLWQLNTGTGNMEYFYV